jgi:hypothetical protein
MATSKSDIILARREGEERSRGRGAASQLTNSPPFKLYSASLEHVIPSIPLTVS